MSSINIKRTVDNIRAGTNIYTPIIEVIVNAIQTIEFIGRESGLVTVEILRSGQRNLDNSKPPICGFSISDNGEGFSEQNRDAFDTLYTENKAHEGGKGFGRFTCLKYFSSVEIESVFHVDSQFKSRSFKMGRDTDIIVDEKIGPSASTETGTTVRLLSPKSNYAERSVNSLGRTLVEKLLPYLLCENPKCPRIVLVDEFSNETITLNDYLNNSSDSLISEIAEAIGSFSIGAKNSDETFESRVFKIFSPKKTRSKVSLVAHRREVTTTSLHAYIPEFIEEFCETNTTSGDEERNFIIQVYVFGNYLDSNVSLERGGFEFQRETDLTYGISQKEIERRASEFALKAMCEDVSLRKERKSRKVASYVKDKAPWHINTLKNADLSDMPYKPSDADIDSHLHRIKYQQEVQVKADIRALLSEAPNGDVSERTSNILERVSHSSQSELVHYVALRKSVLDIFEKSFEIDSDGKYPKESIVHNIIFPQGSDSDSVSYNQHNLWIIDERLNFAEYLASDMPLNGKLSDRPDILSFDRRIGFRGDNEASNPVTIFEFKRPQRDDFANPSSKEDPVQQIIRYVIAIRNGKYKTPRGRDISVSDNTPFYGYVICDLTPKVKAWLEEEKDYKPMPDGRGYFDYHQKLNLYTEVLSWDKVLNDACMRNKIFFHKLGLE